MDGAPTDNASRVGKNMVRPCKVDYFVVVSVKKIDEYKTAVFGTVDNERACRNALTRWLMRQTRKHLVPRLHELGAELGLPFRRTFVKASQDALGKLLKTFAD